MSGTPSSDDDRPSEFDPRIPDDVLALAQGFYNEWYNGGFAQLFANWNSADAELIPAALKAIGAPAGAAVVEAAIAELGPRRQWQQRGHEALIDPSSPLRQRFWDLDGEFGKHDDRLMGLITQFELKLSEATEDEDGAHDPR